MKRSRIVLFLFGVIAILALLCAVFPEDGFLGLRFPQLGEVLAGAEPQKGPSPEELIEQRRQAVLAAERDQYRSFFAEDPARFSLPDDDVRFFDSLFEALDRAGETDWGRAMLRRNPVFQNARAALERPEITPEDRVRLKTRIHYRAHGNGHISPCHCQHRAISYILGH
jgi:hypothetical protein